MTFKKSENSGKIIVDQSKDVWEIVNINIKEFTKHVSVDDDADGAANAYLKKETTIVLLGSRGSGKSTMASLICGHFFKVEHRSARSTLGVDYSYARRTAGGSNHLVHIWEVTSEYGVGVPVLETIITPENVHSCLVFIIVEAGDPSGAFSSAALWARSVDQRVQEILQKMRAKGSGTPEKMHKLTKNRLLAAGKIGEAELKSLRMQCVPLTVFVNKWDLLRQLDSGALRLFVSSMRFFSYIYGASLIFSSFLVERELEKLRTFLDFVLYGGGGPLSTAAGVASAWELTAFRMYQPDANNGGVVVLAGSEGATEIGEPERGGSNSFVPSDDTELERWRMPLEKRFPPKSTERNNSGEEIITCSDERFLKLISDPESGFTETAIDEAVNKSLNAESPSKLV